MDCRAEIAAQDEDYPTYKYLDCTLQTLANDDNFYGGLIDCQLAIIRTLVDACKNWNQGVRTTVTIDGEDVTSALVGDINISRRKNQIATFSLQLNDTQYSPLTNPHIFPDKEVIIVSYLNKHEATLFTGLIDDTQTRWDGRFNISINGSGYGKKLRNARKTLVNIQDSATSQYRGDLVKYLVGQAEIPSSKINTAQGSYTRIDHSFEDQSILDMVDKELVIDSMQWEFDENKTFNTFLDEIKSSTGTYPTADWTYGEDRFFYLDLKTSDDNIINDVKILGSVYETQILVPDEDSGGDSPYNQYTYATTLFSDSLSYTDGEEIFYDADSNHTKTVGDFTLKIQAYGYSAGGGNIHIYIGNSNQFIFQSYEITSIDYTLDGIVFRKLRPQVSGLGLHAISFVLTRQGEGEGYTGDAFTFSVSVKGYSLQDDDGGVNTQTDESSPTYDYKYDQVAVHVEDFYSIDKYGRRKPNTAGTLEFPLSENVDRCREIGRKIIKDSHKNIKQPTFEVPFNPLLKVGQTISITDKKIGYSQRWYVEEVNHTIGQGKGRTRVGCVYYT